MATQDVLDKINAELRASSVEDAVIIDVLKSTLTEVDSSVTSETVMAAVNADTQVAAVSPIATPSTATATDVANAFNALLNALQT